ncbi:glycoside hydrolase family 2 protein [Flavicella sediminum]|uniref:glycoside hydrolase family 2 protein n=1 Tax=Flavicella sediminum TaxID=2585141 RepID=UPI00140C4494|nr:glycoside hydrolase family 2 TIM barrel-domain containing protein [Flavicella sediminum]
MKKITPFILSLFLIGCNVHKQATKNTNNTDLSLNGTWNFLANNDIQETEVLHANYSTWDQMSVPGNWDSENKYSNYVGKGYYQKNITIPQAWKGKQVRLKFDAVYETSKVWLNGELLGTHKGGYTPFEFNISKNASYGAINSLVVLADNSFKRGAWWAWGGISRDIHIYTNDAIRLVWQHIDAVPNFSKGIVHFKIEYKIENNGEKAEHLKIVSNIKTASGDTCVTKQQMLEAQNGITKTSVEFSEKLADLELWHFDHPTLYLLTSEISTKSKILQIDSAKFGIRKLEVKGEKLVLNNEPIRVNGFNRVHDHRSFGNTEPDELIQQDILDIKSLGGTFSRIMHAPASENLLAFCDSIGYMLIEEIPVWGRGAPNARANNPITKQWLTEMIERDYNHASVVGWSVGNEIGNLDGDWADMTMTPDQYNYVNSMFDHVIALDPNRLKTYASFTAYLPKSDNTNEPVAKADFISINTYGKAYDKAVKTHKKFPNKPIFFSEIGKGQIGETNTSQLAKSLVDDLAEIQELPYVMGSALWTYNDYRSNYKATPASGNRAWGVVDVWRNKKPVAYNQIQDIYAPIKNISFTLSDRWINVMVTPKSIKELPSYILKNYHLTCRFFDENDKEIASQKSKLPTIHPGDELFFISFKNIYKAAYFKISLQSPLGIEMKTIFNHSKKSLKKDQNLSDRIIHLEKRTNEIILGYNVSEEETSFTIKYGENIPSKTIETKLKGSIKIPWQSNKPFTIQMKSNKSDWSKIKSIN